MVKKRIKPNRNNLSPPTWWRILLLFALAAGCIVFGILALQSLRVGALGKYTGWLSMLACVGVAALVSFIIVALCKRKTLLYRTAFSGLFVLLFFLVTLYFVLKTDFLTILQTPELYQSFLEKTGAWMPLLYIILQFLQVILLPLPSIVSTLAGIALFGAFWTSLYSFIGIFLGSIVAFVVGRKLGYKVVVWLLGEDALKKWLEKVKGKDALVLTMMFLLPLFPDDVLCFVAGLSTMPFVYFLWISAISRAIAIFATCFSVYFIPLNAWWGWLAWGLLLAVLSVFFFYAYKNIDRIQVFLRKIKGKRNKSAKGKMR